MSQGQLRDRNNNLVPAFTVGSALDTIPSETAGDPRFAPYTHFFCGDDIAVTINGLARTLPANTPYALTDTITFNGTYALVLM